MCSYWKISVAPIAALIAYDAVALKGRSENEELGMSGSDGVSLRADGGSRDPGGVQNDGTDDTDIVRRTVERVVYEMKMVVEP